MKLNQPSGFTPIFSIVVLLKNIVNLTNDIILSNSY